MNVVMGLATGTEKCVDRIVKRLDEDQYQLSNGRKVKVAFSCLIEPLTGDTVLVEAGYVLAILKRSEAKHATLQFRGCDDAVIAADNLSVIADQSLTINAKKEINLLSVGALRIAVHDWVSRVLGTQVDESGTRISNAQTWLTTVTSFWRAQGADIHIVGEQDVRIDAERVSMG